MPKPKRHIVAWGAGALLPLGLGLAANIASPAGATTAVSSGAAPSSGAVASAGAVTSGGASATEASTVNIIAATDAIPRIGLDGPGDEVSDTWAKPVPNKSKLGSCGWFGAAGSDKETNHRKNRTDLPKEYHAVAFSAVMDLDWPHEATTRRDKWTKAQLDQIAPFEGEALTVTGFIAALKPQGQSGEATNCNQTGESNTDWHIALVGEAGDPESKSMVVEVTPRIKQRHPNWTPTQLKPFVGAPDSVRVSGWLLFDPVHKGHLNKYRATLWEIHPIHRIEVFRGGAWHDVDAP